MLEGRRSTLFLMCAFTACSFLIQTATVAAKEDDLTKAVKNGTQIIKYLTVATDNGINAVGIVSRMYPEEKTKAIVGKVQKYNELKKKRGKDKLLDEEQIRLATEIAGDMALMEPDWMSYDKSKADKMKLLKADKKLALVVMADAKAALRTAKLIPALAGIALNPVDALKSSISNFGNLKKAKKLYGIALVAKEHIPLQQQSFSTTGVIVKNISGAEGIGLPKDHSEDDAKDTESLEKNIGDGETE